MSNTITLPFLDALAMADCAARVLSQHRPKPDADESHRRTRTILTQEAVRALRFLWRTGDPHQRALVAARIAIWHHRQPDSERIYFRETNRISNQQTTNHNAR